MQRVSLPAMMVSAAASLGVAAQHSEAVSPALVWPSVDVTNSPASQLIEISSGFSAHAQLLIGAPLGDRWTNVEKTRYKRLAVRQATSEISKAEQQELDSLEATRAKFEDVRTAAEIIAEAQVRENYAKLLSSLKSLSLGKTQ
jgi:hypothetical protein